MSSGWFVAAADGVVGVSGLAIADDETTVCGATDRFLRGLAKDRLTRTEVRGLRRRIIGQVIGMVLLF